MLVLFLLTREWLVGSLFVPILLVLRIGGAKWRRLGWLTRSKKRWLIVWSCYGLAGALAFDTIRAIHYWYFLYPSDIGLPTLSYAVSYALWRVFHVSAASFWIAASIGAVLEALVDAGWAAFVWWMFQWWGEHRRTRENVSVLTKCAWSLLVSAWAFGVANYIHFRRPIWCADCSWPSGFPFLFYHEGNGWGGPPGFMWKGVTGNAIAILLVGVALVLIWWWVPQRKTGTPV